MNTLNSSKNKKDYIGAIVKPTTSCWLTTDSYERIVRHEKQVIVTPYNLLIVIDIKFEDVQVLTEQGLIGWIFKDLVKLV